MDIMLFVCFTIVPLLIWAIIIIYMISYIVSHIDKKSSYKNTATRQRFFDLWQKFATRNTVARQRLFDPWQKFATTKKLEFTQTIFNSQMQINIRYRGHLVIAGWFLTRDGEGAILSTITVRADRRFKKQICSNEVRAVFRRPQRLLLHKGPTVEPLGQSLRYEQESWIRNAEDLQSLLDWLIDLSEAYPAIVALGSEIALTLQNILKEEPAASAVAIQLLKDIALETAYISRRSHYMLCSRCLTHPAAHTLNLDGWSSVSYFGCRLCGQSRDFLNAPGDRVIAVLNRGMTAEWLEQEVALRVNWLIRRSLFDFNEVEIVQATDEEVERFAVQIGNDTDPARRPYYKKMPCRVNEECRLAPDSLRILRRVFDKVEVQAGN